MPWSVDSLVGDLHALGLTPGATVLVHASLRRIGRVAGGAGGVVAALSRVLGAQGTIAVPTFTEENSQTSHAHRRRTAGLTEEQRQAYRAAMPAFDKASTVSSGGRISEHVRLLPEAERSDHPVVSFAAVGRRAKELTADHPHESYHGERSPLGRMCAEGAAVLMAGVGWKQCTAFHLAEHRVPGRPRTTYRFVVDDGSGPRWDGVESIYLDDSDFAALGADFERESAAVARGRLGAADARLAPMVAAVDFAVRWLPEHRRAR